MKATKTINSPLKKMIRNFGNPIKDSQSSYRMQFVICAFYQKHLRNMSVYLIFLYTVQYLNETLVTQVILTTYIHRTYKKFIYE